MKTIALSIEQMKHLESLGLDTSDASMYWFKDGDFEQLMYYKGALLDESTDTIMCIPAYTLQDILDKLPQKVHLYPDDNSLDNTAFFTMNKMEGGGYFMAYEQSWDDANGKLKIVMHGRQQKDNAIDAAYNILLWCIENNYIKTNEKSKSD